MLILASSSPRRHELLNAAGIKHVVRPVSVDESAEPGESAHAYVVRVSLAKALAAACPRNHTVLAADTAVAVDGRIFGKPVDQSDAQRMLAILSGRRHKVLTGIAIRRGETVSSAVSETHVAFLPLTAADIDAYVATGEPLDKAGAYGIQGYASRFVASIDGCYHNVVGLPVSLVWQHLRSLPAHE